MIDPDPLVAVARTRLLGMAALSAVRLGFATRLIQSLAGRR